MEINTTCKNCNAKLNGNFCNNCGQRSSVNKVTFKETFHDFVDMVFSVNAPLMLTIKMLVVNPGKLFREYLNGKRKKYYKPVAFLILTTIVLVVLKSLLNYDPMSGYVITEGDTMNASLLKEAEGFMSRNSNNLIFIFVFTFSAALKMFFSKKYIWSEYVAISFYIIGFYTLMTSLMMFYLIFVSTQHQMITLIFLLLYVLYAVTSFFKSISFFTIIKVFLTYFISLFFYMILGFGLSFLIVWLKAT